MRAGALRYWSFTLAGLLLAGAGLVAMNWGLYELMQTGTCASGGPYEIGRPCPDGTGLRIAAIGGGPFVAAIGYGLFVFRGRRGGGPIGPGSLMWAALFLSLAGTATWAAFGPDATDDDGAKIAALVLLVTFVPMALFPLLGSFFWRRGVKQAEAPETQEVYRSRIIEPVTEPPSTWQPASAPARTEPRGTLVARMQELNRLREEGLISVGEFEQQKQRLLGGI